MKRLLTCRECGHREHANNGNGLMSRIKMWNHVERVHDDWNIQPSQMRLIVREDNESRMGQEVYRMQVAH